MIRLILIGTAAALVATGTFIYAAVSTLCDDDYWPDW